MCVTRTQGVENQEFVSKVVSAGLVLRSQQIAVTTHLPAVLMEPSQDSAPLLMHKERTGKHAVCCDKPDLLTQDNSLVFPEWSQLCQQAPYLWSALLGLPSVPILSW